MASSPLNLSRLIDDRPMSGLQITVLVLCGLVNVLDGINTQSIGVAAPFIAKSLAIPVTHFGIVFSAALLGAALGAVGFGAVADRLGRKPLLIAAVLIFGVFTIWTAHAQSVPVLLAVRFIAGIGLGGATPCFITLSSEYAPARRRAGYVTLMWAGFPLGATVGALTNSMLLPAFGWRAIFYLGGGSALVLAALLLVALPESLKILVTRTGSSEAIARILRRMKVAGLSRDTVFSVDDDRMVGAPLKLVFTEGRAIGTFLLWVPFFMGFGILTVAVLWTPTLLRMHGISPAATAFVVAFSGFGGIFGMASAGALLQRFGSISTLVPAFFIGAVTLAGLGYSVSSVPMAATFIGLNGLFMGCASAGAIALAAQIYPTAVRSTGIGLCMAIGRVGQMVGPLVAGRMVEVGWAAGPIMTVIGVGGLIGAAFVVLLKLWTQNRVPVAMTVVATTT